MQKSFRLKSAASFRYIYRKGKSYSGKYMTVSLVPAYNLKVGFSVSKRVGKAVVRNLVKRRLREAFRIQLEGVPQNCNYVVTAKEAAASATYSQLYDDLQALFRRVVCAEAKK